VSIFSAAINAFACNNVDGAEESASRPIAWKLNAEVPGELARVCRDACAAFVQYSTDYEFAGDKSEGYAEDDAPGPISVYGESKLAGEQAVAAAGVRWYVCRLAKAELAARVLEIMRRLLRDIAAGRETVGDTTTLEDYTVLAKLRDDE
jgi:dTDP-4-dehydrorhamnose reductase